ncbi:MAG: CBS domain-containing protein [Thermoanaerobaculia bacterium]
MKQTPVSEFMSRDLTSASKEMPLTELVALFKEKKVRGLPVTDDDNRLLGVVTERDIFLKEKGVPFSLETVPTLLGQIIDKADIDQVERCRQVTVEDVMRANVSTVTATDTLEDVGMLMYEEKRALVPVVEDEKLVGVVRRIHVLGEIYTDD